MGPDLNHALLQRINLNHLVTFLAVAEARSFRGAAAVRNVSQSALSVQIRQLEDALGTRLFDRTTRSVNLTPTGTRILPVARQLAKEVTAVARALQEEANLKKHTVRLATNPLGAHIVPAAIRAFGNLHKDLDVHLVVKETSKAVASLLGDDEADLGILYLQSESPEFSFTEILRDEFLAAVPSSDPFLASLTQISLKDLSVQKFLIQPQGSFVREVLDAQFKAQNLTPNVLLELRPADGLIALVSAGLGVAVLPQGTARFLNLNGCHLMKLKDVTPRPLGLALPAKKRSSTAAVALHDFLARHLRPVLSATMVDSGDQPSRTKQKPSRRRASRKASARR